MSASDERYFRMKASLGFINGSREIVVGPVPDDAVSDHGYPDKEYWIDALWEYLEVSFEEIDEEQAKRERGW
jgi:hypothetical protein